MQDSLTKKILVIDDDAAMQKVLKINLENAGYKVLLAGSGEESLSLLDRQENLPDCILSDIKMPGMSGLDLLGLLKEKFPLIPIIMLTAHTDLETGLQAMRMGAFDYITKPVRKAEILEFLKKGLEQQKVLEENQRLKYENRKYQENLEYRVELRTRELLDAYDKLKETNLATVRVLAETIEAKDPYTRGHCHRVRFFAREIARHMGLSSYEIECLEYGALLHDIGKIGVPEELLHKAELLTPKEKLVFEDHPVIGENILKVVEFFVPCLPIVKQHHEWFNGQGYPLGLKGLDIHILARIVQVADSFDAMTTNRPYRKGLPLQEAVLELAEGKSIQFDPEIIDVFLNNQLYLLDPDLSY